MEALGGSASWTDRFLGYHIAIGYYWALNALFLFSPRAAYEFMEVRLLVPLAWFAFLFFLTLLLSFCFFYTNQLLESHAVDTYTTFLEENEERLRSLPAPRIAKSYYTSGDLYMFDEFQVSTEPGSRRPPCDSLYDVFVNISEDEAEHVKTMVACQDYAMLGRLVTSPHLTGVDQMKTVAEENKDKEGKRQTWKAWAESMNEGSLVESKSMEKQEVE